MESNNTNKENRILLFEEELGLIKNSSIRRWTEDCLLLAPEYIFEISTSGSGSHHPPWALGPGGLVRHTKAVTMLAYMMSGTFYGDYFLEREGSSIQTLKTDGIVSAILSACILHDSCKYGIPYDLRMHQLHPYIPRIYFGNVDGSLSPAERNYIFTLIESHMGSYENGSWSPIAKLTTDTLTSNPAAMIVHTADYLASKTNYVDARFINLDPAIAGREAHVEYDPFPDNIIYGLVLGVLMDTRTQDVIDKAIADGSVDAVCERAKRLRTPRKTRTSKYNLDGIIANIRENVDLIIPRQEVGDSSEQ